MFGTLVGAYVFSDMWLELLMMLKINVPLRSSVYEYQSVECVFTSPVSMECCVSVIS